MQLNNFLLMLAGLIYPTYGLLSSHGTDSPPIALPFFRSSATSRQQEARKTCIVTMRDRTSEILNRFAGTVFNSRNERLSFVTDLLQRFSMDSQRPLLTFLTQLVGPGNLDSAWITNQVIFRNCSEENSAQVSIFPGVENVTEDRQYPLDPVILAAEEGSGTTNGSNGGKAQWGVERIQAPQVWAQGLVGSGIVVANIDTGVLGTHEILRDNYRRKYGWYDPANKTTTPSDNDGHGTHTMGTLAGKSGFGVAPNSTWIACKACPDSSCSLSLLIQCTQWMLCPTDTNGNNQDCSKAPHVVSNSWVGGNDSFIALTMAMNAAGIVSLYAVGNTGPKCDTAVTPAKYENVIAVGSTTINNTIATSSSIGSRNSSKPDVSAPGVNILSAFNRADSSYASLSGTSMACPHAAGLVALMLQKNPNLSTEQVKNILRGGTVPVDTSQRMECGVDTGRTRPNSYAGFGLINSPNSIRLTPRRTTGGGTWWPFTFFG